MKSEFVKSIIGILILACSLVLIGMGIANREVLTVFNKAVNICMECIGIG